MFNLLKITIMAKTAFLVTLCPMTRVVVDVANPDELTDDEVEKIVQKARERILDDADNKLNCENIDEIVPDEECPYGTIQGDNNW